MSGFSDTFHGKYKKIKGKHKNIQGGGGGGGEGAPLCIFLCVPLNFLYVPGKKS